MGAGPGGEAEESAATSTADQEAADSTEADEAVTGAIVSIQLPGDQRKNSERYLRAVTEDTRVETIREVVTAMMKKPSDFVIGSKTPKKLWGSTTVVKGDEDVMPGVDEVVEAAFT